MGVNPEVSQSSEVHRRFHLTLAWLYGVALFSVLGYATFGRHPHWLGMIPGVMGQGAMWFYSISFRLFGEGQTWVMAVVCLAYVSTQVRWAWVPVGLAVIAVSLISELTGTIYGFPFGAYTYSKTLLGPMVAGHVPIVIPVSWWMMAIPAFALAHAAYPPHNRKQRVRMITFGALLITLWDVSLDPAMSYLVPYWTWTQKGMFYGMPLQNWLGWYATALVLMIVMSIFSAERWISQLSLSWLRSFYLLNLLVPFGMILVAGLWWGVLVKLVACVICLHWLLPPHLRLHRWFFEHRPDIDTIVLRDITAQS